MGLWDMIIIVVALGVGAQVLTAYFKSKEIGMIDDEVLRRKLGLDRIDQLEERIKVLERIVTDKSHNLKQEIDRL
jgi:hypothetical protein